MEALTVVKLKQLSKDLGIKAGYLMTKGELIKLERNDCCRIKTIL
jgi:hypothetical protein